MAERRMFAKTIIDSDAFLDMPSSARLLYYDFGMRADDDGFVNNPKKIIRMTGASDDDIKFLIAKKFIIPFESGIVVIKHWKIHNYIQKDRYIETKYKDEKASLSLDENKAYTLSPSISDALCIQDGYNVDTQVRLGKVRLGKVRLNIYSPVIEYLNDKTGKKFKVSSAKTKALIDARVNEGFGLEDFKTVINNKFADWGIPPKAGQKDMRPFLRPETLFGPKFEGYLNQTPAETPDTRKEGEIW